MVIVAIGYILISIIFTGCKTFSADLVPEDETNGPELPGSC